MVSEQEKALSPQGEPDFEALARQMDAAGEFADSTAPEVDAEINSEAATADVDEANSPAEETAEPEPRTPAPEQVEPPQATEAQQSQEAEKPKPRLTESPEFREWQSKKDKELADLQKKIQEFEQEKQQAAARKEVDSNVEAHLQSEERRLSLSGMSAEDARAAARDPQFVKQVRDHFQGIAAQQQSQQREQVLMKALDLAGRQVAASQYMAQYGVAETDREFLMGAESPQAMEAMAKRLGQRRSADEQSRQARRDVVPRETAATQPTNGTSDAPVKPGFWDLLESAQHKPWSEMTPDEKAATERVMNGSLPE